MYRFGLVGNPVKHSLSPKLHNAFAKQFGHEIQYDLFEIKPNNLKDWVMNFRQYGAGFNVTSPYKVVIKQYLSKQPATLAVNSVVCTEELMGDTFDGVGFAYALRLHRLKVAGKKILVLGGGDVLHSILPVLLYYKPASVVVAVRNPDKVDKSFDERVCVKKINFLDDSFDGIVQATSCYLSENQLNLNKGWFAENAWIMDLNYNNAHDSFKDQLLDIGVSCYTADGLAMLKAQAAHSYFHWTKAMPDLSLLGDNF